MSTPRTENKWLAQRTALRLRLAAMLPRDSSDRRLLAGRPVLCGLDLPGPNARG